MPFTVGKVAEFMANGRLTSASYYDRDGVMRLSPSGGIRMDHDPVSKAPLGVLLEELRTNKCTNRNANPIDLTGLTLSNSGGTATLTIVDDVAALAAAGLQALCTSGKVIRLAFTSVTWAKVDINAPAGNANAHIASAYVRGSAGEIAMTGSLGNEPFTAAAAYRRVFSESVPGSGVEILGAGTGVIYIVLNQLEEGAFATSVIPVVGASATRSADELSIIGDTTKAWFNPDAWSFFFDFIPGLGGGERGLLYTASATLVKIRSDGHPAIRVQGYSAAIVLTPAVVGGLNRLATAFEASVITASLNGAAVQSADIDTGTGTTIDVSPAEAFNGHILRMGYLPRKMTDAELVALTD